MRTKFLNGVHHTSMTTYYFLCIHTNGLWYVEKCTESCNDGKHDCSICSLFGGYKSRSVAKGIATRYGITIKEV